MQLARVIAVCITASGALFLSTHLPVFAAELPTGIRGELLVGGATLVDPPPEQRTDTHAYFTIQGASARRVYHLLRAKPEKDLCIPGQVRKALGNVSCSARLKAGNYQCDFALDLTRGTLAQGPPC